MRFPRVIPGVIVILCGWIGHAAAQEAVLLKYKHAKGDTGVYRQSMEMKQSQGFMGMNMENTMRQEAILTGVVEEVASDGKATWKLKADRRKMTAEFGPLGKYEFDSKSSERDTSSQLGASLTPMLERLTGSEYQVVVSPLGEVVEVKGYAELIADLVQGNPFAAQFGAGDNKSATVNEQDSFVILSDKPVKPGDKWEVPFDREMAMLGTMKGKLTYVYEGPDKVGDRKTARIGVTIDMTMDLNLDQGGTKVTGTISTSKSSGVAQFDVEAGRLLSVKRSMSMGGQLSVDVGGMTIAIDNTQEQDSTLELLDKLPQ